MRAPPLPAPDRTWALRSAHGANSGKAYAFLAQGRAALSHPILFVEGFPGNHPLSYLIPVLDQHRLMTRLRALGYDLIVVGLEQGTDRIQNNAGVVEDCIAQAQRLTPEPLVVVGMSMGGLVTRYALARMEQQGRDHRTRAYLSLDAPHRGAYTSLAAQWFAHAFGVARAEIAQLSQMLDSPANQQLMSHWLKDGEVIESPLRRELLDEFAALGGYPQRLQRWAIASGRGDGLRSFAPQQPALDWPGDAQFGAQLWTLAEKASARVGQGRCAGVECRPLDHFSQWSWESAPGGQGRYLESAAQCAQLVGRGAAQTALALSCSVPTASALDLALDPFVPIPSAVESGAPFHDYCFQSENHPHLYFAPPTADWLLQRLGRPGHENPR